MTLRRLRWRWSCWCYQHGGEWCRIQEWRIAAWYHRRAVYPWAMWQAFGEPEGFRPPWRWWLEPVGLVLQLFGFVPPPRRRRRPREERFPGALGM